MPPASSVEILVALGAIAAAAVFTVLSMIVLALMIIEEIALRLKKLYVYLLVRQQNQ